MHYRNPYVAIFAIALIMSTSGCTAMHTAIAKRNLDVQTRMSHTVFLMPQRTRGAESGVYVNIRNTSDKPQFAEVEHRLAAMLEARGFTLTEDPDAAQYIIQGQILQVERTTPQQLAGYYGTGYGAPLGGAVAGATIAGLAGYGGRAGLIGAGVGALVGSAVGTWVNAATQDVVYVTLTDIRLGERVKGQVDTKLTAANQNGTGGTVHQIYDAKSGMLFHQTRVVSSANKVNLRFEDAAPALVEGLAQSLAGLL